MTETRMSLEPVATTAALLAVTALGLSAGAMLTEGAVLVPYWRSLPPDSFLSWYAENASLLFDFFGPLEIASAFLAVVAAGLYRFKRRRGSGLLVLSAVLALAVLVAFPLYFQEVNASFAMGAMSPDNVEAELARWASWHWGRTAVGIGAFAAAVLARISR